jgi:hypothetical protein
VRISVFAGLAAALGASCATAGPPAHRIVYGGGDPHSLDVASLVPSRSAIDGIWFVPAGRTQPQIAVVWRRREGPADSYGTGVRFSLSLWNPEGRATWGSIRWVEHRLVRSTPYPIALRLADVTHDGHADLLVDSAPQGANGGLDFISVFATFGRHVRRIYGGGCEKTKYGPACGRGISESSWGAKKGLLWFDEPRGGSAACCPEFQLYYTLTWTRKGWRTVSRKLTRIHYG